MIIQAYHQQKIKFARLMDDVITTIQRFRPRNYFYKLRILRVTGSLDSTIENQHLLIFIVFEKYSLPKKTIEALRIFKAHGIQLLIINNGNPNFEDQLIKNGANLVITRNNTGKDFGGYKDATLFLRKNNLTKWKKIIYGNDSVIYPNRIIQKLIAELINHEFDYIAHSQVKEIHFHFQSFIFSCSNDLFNNKIFYEFWKYYIPLDRRRYMIKKGEVGLTKKILKTGCSIKVINTYEDFDYEIADFETINNLFNELPDRYRTQRKFIEIQSKIAELILQTESIRSSKEASIEIKKSQINQSIAKDQATKSLYLNAAKNLLREMSAGNPTHIGISYFLKSKQPFVIKRDLAYRAGYDYDFVISLINKYYPDEKIEICSMIKFPSGNHYKGWKQIMFHDGMI